MATDPELLEAWRAGDKSAGDELFGRYFESVCRFFRNKAPGALEDLVQRTFLACLQRRDALRDDANFKAYLFTVARNELHGHIRGKLRAPEQLDTDAVSVHELGASPSSIVAHNRVQRLLLQALREMPIDDQITLESYYWEEMSGPELAQVLGASEGAIRSRLRRAKDRLQKRMEELTASGERLETTAMNLEGWARELRDQRDDEG